MNNSFFRGSSSATKLLLLVSTGGLDDVHSTDETNQIESWSWVVTHILRYQPIATQKHFYRIRPIGVLIFIDRQDQTFHDQEIIDSLVINMNI